MDSVDLVLRSIVEFGLGLLFLSSGMQKLRHPRVFRSALSEYRLLPGFLVSWVAALVVVAELVAGFGVFVPDARAYAILAIAVLLLVYTMAIGINLLRGRRDIDCGCGGPARRQTLSSWLVVRNLTLMVLALGCLLPAADRVLQWMDFVTIGFGVVAFLLLYAMVNSLAANQPKLQQLRTPGHG